MPIQANNGEKVVMVTSAALTVSVTVPGRILKVVTSALGAKSKEWNADGQPGAV
jgi:hypothetical protein